MSQPLINEKFRELVLHDDLGIPTKWALKPFFIVLEDEKASTNAMLHCMIVITEATSHISLKTHLALLFLGTVNQHIGKIWDHMERYRASEYHTTKE